MIYKGIIYYPKFYQDIADYIGLERWKRNKRTRKNNNAYNRASKEQEIKIDVIGVLAEMITLHHLLSKEKDFDYSVLLSKNPAIKNDIVVKSDGKSLRYEVKAITGNIARINKESHEKKICDFYALVRPTKELDKIMQGGAYFWTEQYLNVANEWKLMQGQYGSPYYEKQMIIDAMDIITEASNRFENK